MGLAGQMQPLLKSPMRWRSRPVVRILCRDNPHFRISPTPRSESNFSAKLTHSTSANKMLPFRNAPRMPRNARRCRVHSWVGRMSDKLDSCWRAGGSKRIETVVLRARPTPTVLRWPASIGNGVRIGASTRVAWNVAASSLACRSMSVRGWKFR